MKGQSIIDGVPVKNANGPLVDVRFRKNEESDLYVLPVHRVKAWRAPDEDGHRRPQYQTVKTLIFPHSMDASLYVEDRLVLSDGYWQPWDPPRKGWAPPGA